MSEQSSNIVSKVWGLCNPLRDDGVSYGDYLEQLTYLIFLKMSDEYSRPPYKRETGIPKGYTWSDMNTLKGAELENQYRAILERLGDEGGILGQIFKGAVNKISNVSILYRVVQMIDKENWVSMSSDVKGEIYEGLLQKNAEDVKSGAGQYFTPRPLIKAMVACLRPKPKKTIADPCCGSGGFFLAAQAFLADPKNYALDRTEKEFLKNETFYGTELVVATFKLCLMNLYLHNIGDLYGKVPVMRGDALLSDPGYRVDYVLTNPPFGKKSSITFTNEEEEQEEEDLVYNRQDFWTTSSNKQLNFIQHINTILKPTGKAAVVVPDNVLFEGGAGEIIDRTYPASNRELRKKIEQKGCVISEYPPESGPVGPNGFLQRNRLIAALSSALVVVEAQEKSGTMSTVNHAERYGKPVFVVPGSIYSPNSAGTNALLWEGRAKAVCKPGDLFGVLGLRGAAAPAAVRSAPDPMSETERRVLACIGPKAKGVEELGTASGLPTGLLLGTLMKLELAGRVTCLPGKRYILR